ncbi:hypothetical protein ACA910_021763 [Epithemia clementina (nom. ined.)]
MQNLRWGIKQGLQTLGGGNLASGNFVDLNSRLGSSNFVYPCWEVKGLSMSKGNRKVDHKMLEQVAGFLNHVAWVFPTILIFLNGVYATMSPWRPGRDKYEWNIGNYKVEASTPKSAQFM